MLPKKPRRGDLIRWAGGKRALAPRIAGLFPTGQVHYCEPFLGGGAVFLELLGQNRLAPDATWLNDANVDLVAFWDEVLESGTPRDQIDDLMGLARSWTTDHDGYQRVRALAPKSQLIRAARFLYVNEIGFNGLWRVNAAGQLNTPKGDRNAIAMTAARLREVGTRASVAVTSLTCGGWLDCVESFLADGPTRPCLYLDPPYHPGAAKSFTAYGPPFGPAEHEALATWARRAIMRHPDLTIVASNADVPEVRELWQGFDVIEVREARAINSDGAGRSPVGALLLYHRGS